MTQWILTSGLLIAAVLLIRAVGRDKLSARVRYALWALVLVRLLVPFSIGESALSVQNWLPETQSAQVQTEPVLIDELIETPQHNTVMDMPVIPITETESHRTYLALPGLIWLAGSLVVGTVFLVSNLRFAMRLRRSRKEVMHRFVPIYVTDAVETPCLFGVLKPAIYITPEVWSDETALQHAMAHELTHYRHKDHVWSVLRCVCVSLHWFNPLVWAAAFLSQKDAEMACDEGAILQLGEQERTGYAKTLMDLTCVGYKGMLTAATSMTGSDSDLKQRILRIVKNPKMSVAAAAIVLVIAILVSLAVFTAAKAPAIEGVWKLEMDVVGEDAPSEAYGEYEVSDGRIRYTLYYDGQIRISEKYTYTLNDKTVIMEFPELETGEYRFGGRVQEHPWSVEGDVLTIGRGRNETHLTAMERKSVPYLPDEFLEVGLISLSRPNERMAAELTDMQEKQLIELLRKGEVTETRREVADNMPYMVGVTFIGNERIYNLAIANGLVYRDDKEVGYVLSNIAEIETFLGTLGWSGQLAANVETDGFVPADMTGITEARMIVYGKAFYADPGQLAFLEELLSTAEDIGYPTKCPFEGILEVTLADGRVLGVTPALDSCAAFMIGDTCYEYGSQFATDDEGGFFSGDLLAVFGLDHAVLEELLTAAYQTAEGEAIGTMADMGDVVRLWDHMMEPTVMNDEARERMISLLAQGIGDTIGEEDVTCETVCYTIISSGQDTADGFVTLSDNGSVYMDGVRYECSTADALLQLLDAQFGMQIAHDGTVIENDWYGAVGEDVYLELQGVPEDGEVIWSSSDETVCTVAGDAYGATVTFTGTGEATVAAQWQSKWNTKGYTIMVYCE